MLTAKRVSGSFLRIPKFVRDAWIRATPARPNDSGEALCKSRPRALRRAARILRRYRTHMRRRRGLRRWGRIQSDRNVFERRTLRWRRAVFQQLHLRTHLLSIDTGEPGRLHDRARLSLAMGYRLVLVLEERVRGGAPREEAVRRQAPEFQDVHSHHAMELAARSDARTRQAAPRAQ